jgi:hypothetical protein
VRAYHGVLERLSIRPHRSVEDDLQLQTAVMSYGGGSSVSVPAGVPARNPAGRAKESGGKNGDCGCGCGGQKNAEAKPSQCGCKPDTQLSNGVGQSAPDFSRMTQAEKLAYNQRERDRIFG